ncbi:MAG: hypothetical protein CSB28_02250, partial [Desulfobacterales bacterium]
LGATPFVMPTSAKILYHAAAVTASNYLVTLVHGALQMMQQTGLDASQAYGLLEPLIYGSLENIKTRGTVNGLTGPIARGDFPIVAGHLKDMEAQLPELLGLYRTMGRYTLDLARQGKGLDDGDGEVLARLLDTNLLMCAVNGQWSLSLFLKGLIGRFQFVFSSNHAGAFFLVINGKIGLSRRCNFSLVQPEQGILELLAGLIA